MWLVIEGRDGFMFYASVCDFTFYVSVPDTILLHMRRCYKKCLAFIGNTVHALWHGLHLSLNSSNKKEKYLSMHLGENEKGNKEVGECLHQVSVIYTVDD